MILVCSGCRHCRGALHCLNRVLKLPWRAGYVTTDLIGLGLIFVFFPAGLPVFFSMAVVGFLGMIYMRGILLVGALWGPFHSIAFSTMHFWWSPRQRRREKRFFLNPVYERKAEI